MAVTVTDVRKSVFGDRRAVTVDVTFDSSYPTGGEALTPSQFGLQVVDVVFAELAVAQTGQATALAVSYDRVNEKLQAFETSGTVDTPFAEVDDTDDLSDYVVRLTAIGH